MRAREAAALMGHKAVRGLAVTAASAVAQQVRKQGRWQGMLAASSNVSNRNTAWRSLVMATIAVLRWGNAAVEDLREKVSFRYDRLTDPAQMTVWWRHARLDPGSRRGPRRMCWGSSAVIAHVA